MSRQDWTIRLLQAAIFAEPEGAVDRESETVTIRYNGDAAELAQLAFEAGWEASGRLGVPIEEPVWRADELA
jgi:hypothetical protein